MPTTTNAPATLADIESALASIPADDRDVWIKVGMAIQSELGDAGFSLFDYWSQSADSYRERDTRDVWRSFKAGSIAIGRRLDQRRIRTGASTSTAGQAVAETAAQGYQCIRVGTLGAR
jgi:putative DNA primase/helicase